MRGQPPDSDPQFNALLRELARGPTEEIDSRAPSLVGTSLGHYRILSLLGRGGLGTVLLAEDTKLLRRVALKLVHCASGLPEHEAVLNEARAAAAVVHPNVASVFGVEEHDGRTVLVMEYVAGKTLRQLIPSGGLPWRQAFRYAEQIARGLGAAHRLGIVHRDLKPDNVMVTTDGAARILDFGLAHREGAAAEDGSMPGGTPRYMAPEVVAGARADRRADVFAFGATLHELLVGTAGSARASGPRKAPAALTRLVSRCLETDPSRRPQDASELVQALARCAPSRRRALPIAVALLLAVVAAVVALRFGAEAPRTARLQQLTFNSVEAPVSQAALSPDGRRVAFVDTRGLLVLDLDTRAERQILSKDQVDVFSFVTWFDDGRLVVRERERGGAAQLLMIDASGRARTLGAPNTWRFAVPSPSGRQIAYVRSLPGGRGEVGTFAVGEPTILRPLFSTAQKEERVFSNLAWSPDGSRLAFGRYLGHFDVRDASLLVTHLVSGRTRTVLRSESLFQQSYTAAFTWTGQSTLAWSAAPSTGDLQQLHSLAVGDDAPPRGPGPVIAAFHAPVIDRLSCNQGATRFMFIRFSKQADVWLGRLENNASTLSDPHRLTLTDRDEWPSDWLAEDRELLVLAEREKGYAAARVPATGGVMTPLVSLPGSSTWPISSSRGTLFWWVIPGALTAGLWRIDPHGGANALPLSIELGGVRGSGRPPPRQAWLRCALHLCVLGRQQQGGVVLDELGPGGELRRLGGPLDIPWTRGISLSADGERVAIVDQAHRRIVVAALDGKLLQELRPTSGVAQFASWMPDGQSLIVSTLGGAHYSTLERWGLDGQRSTLLSSQWAWLTHPLVSHDGRSVAYAATPFHGNVWSLEP